jgi:peptidoglycan/xylan/chitin deacetylase (PgdA/CDA1 family)
MMSHGTPFLMYHELEVRGREMVRTDPGFVRYVVKEEEFKRQLTRIRNMGLAAMSVGQSLDASRKNQGVVVSFDDGSETDLLVAAPALRAMGASATFYVVAGHLGRRGFLSVGQLCELADAEFEIGCHSMTHAFLDDLRPKDLQVEMVEAKDRLEQIIGKRIEHFSCPGGRWNMRVEELGRAAGYRSVATSRISMNRPSTNRFRLGRLAVRRGVRAATFDRLCRGEGLVAMRMQDAALSFAKAALGNVLYEKLRVALLEMS